MIVKNFDFDQFNSMVDSVFRKPLKALVFATTPDNNNHYIRPTSEVVVRFRNTDTRISTV